MVLTAFEPWCWRRLLTVPWSPCKEIQPVHPKRDQSWVFIGRTDAEVETQILWPPHVKSWLWKSPWFWEGLGVGGEGDDRGWNGWMVPPTRWTWVWVNFRSWWWTRRPGMLWFMGSQRVGHDWVTELNWTEAVLTCVSPYVPMFPASEMMFLPLSQFFLRIFLSKKSHWFIHIFLDVRMVVTVSMHCKSKSRNEKSPGHLLSTFFDELFVQVCCPFFKKWVICPIIKLQEFLYIQNKSPL